MLLMCAEGNLILHHFHCSTAHSIPFVPGNSCVFEPTTKRKLILDKLKNTSVNISDALHLHL